MTRPAEPLSSNLRGVRLDMSQMTVTSAWSLLRYGDRQQRRAAKRWLQRHKADIRAVLGPIEWRLDK